MELINRQAVLDGIDKYIEKAQSTGTKDDFISFAELGVKALPSAFEGMTFGEVFKSVFANYIGGVYVGKDYVEVAFNDIKTHISYYPTEVWDSPYKGVSE